MVSSVRANASVLGGLQVCHCEQRIDEAIWDPKRDKLRLGALSILRARRLLRYARNDIGSPTRRMTLRLPCRRSQWAGHHAGAGG